MDESIRHALEELESLYGAAAGQLRALAEQRRNLEDRRQRILLQLEEPGDHNPELHRAFRELDEELDKCRARERNTFTEAQAQVDALRERIQTTLRGQRERLSEELREAQMEVDHLRDELIPEARRYLDDLENRHRSAHARSLTLANQLAALGSEDPDLSRFDLAE
jgi:chromosome segregation ATPase